MTGISISARREWLYTLHHFDVSYDDVENYPFGQYFLKDFGIKTVLFYYTGVRKVNASAANQYMIIKFALDKVVVAGTCAGIDSKLNLLDIVIPDTAYQYDCTVREIEPLLKERYSVKLNVGSLDFDFKTGSIGTADKAIVMWEDYLVLKENNIAVGDTEAAAIARVCEANNVECVIIKGISDFPQKSREIDGQIADFMDNVPKIMKNIFDNYIEKLIR